MSSPTFAVIGLGLLGGSLSGALRRAFPRARVIGVSRSPVNVRLAVRKRLIHEGTTNLAKAVSAADWVVICTPVNTIARFVSDIDRHAKRSVIVTDVGSTKGDLIRWVEKRKMRRIHFVGSHPMAGSHLTGLAHAQSDLFRKSFAFVTTHRGVNGRALQQVAALWKKLCRNVFILPAPVHDQIVAEISHLPHLAAAVLVDLASARSSRFAGTGFFDTTRVAASDPLLWTPIFEANRKNLIRLINRFQKRLTGLRRSLQKNQKAPILQLLRSAALKRSKICPVK